MLFGYARVSTRDQNLDLQIDALQAAGVEEGKVFVDKISGGKTTREGLDAVLSHLRAGDELLVWKLDRLGRSMRHLVNLVCDLEERGVVVRILQNGIDTSTGTGKAMIQMFCILAEMERTWIQERTSAGLASARARGRKGGRRAKLGAAQIKRARELYEAKELTTAEIAKVLGVGRATLYRALDLTKDETP